MGCLWVVTGLFRQQTAMGGRLLRRPLRGLCPAKCLPGVSRFRDADPTPATVLIMSNQYS